MDKAPLVSVIVPVYNAEETLPRCLDSIRSQTYPNLEIILVNDGSTDRSLSLCQQYCEEDERFVLIDKSNTGVSDSRNRGMDVATGEYLQFVDSDDWLVSDATETFIRAAITTGCAMVISGFYRVINQGEYPRCHIKETALLSRKQFAESMMEAPANYYYGVSWNKLFKTSIIRKNQLRFPTARSWCEDFLFNLEYLQYAKWVMAVSRPLYYYRKRKGSLLSTQTTLRNTLQTKLELFEYYKSLYKALDLYDENRWKIQLFLLSAAQDGGPSLFRFNPSEKARLRQVGTVKKQSKQKVPRGKVKLIPTK